MEPATLKSWSRTPRPAYLVRNGPRDSLTSHTESPNTMKQEHLHAQVPIRTAASTGIGWTFSRFLVLGLVGLMSSVACSSSTDPIAEERDREDEDEGPVVDNPDSTALHTVVPGLWFV